MNRKRLLRSVTFAALTIISAGLARAETPDTLSLATPPSPAVRTELTTDPVELTDAAGTAPLDKPAVVVEASTNLDAATLGGKQFWADELLFHDWRIQRNVYTNHHRLLDNEDRRRAWGSFEHCRVELERFKRELNLPPMKSKAVIVLHGIWGTRTRMEKLTEYLREHSDYEVLSAAYPSTRAELDSHAASLGQILRNLDGVEEVSFVAHSLGNLVVRRYLAEMKDASPELVPQGQLVRMVMLGPPNRGAHLAAKFRENKIFQSLWGPSGMTLGTDWNEVEPNLALPPCSFGIIAGGRGDESGFNPLLDGDDDFVVRVEETRLPGAADFLVLPVLHGAMMNNVQVQEATLRFLQHGFFVSEEVRQPIPAP